SVSNAKGSFQLEKKSGVWSVRAPAARAKTALDTQKVESLVRTLCGMTVESPAGPESDASYGLRSPEATLVFQRAPAPGDSAAASPRALRARRGRRSAVGEVALEQHDLDAAVLLPALGRVVRGDGLIGPAARRDQSLRIDLALVLEEAHHGRGAGDRQLPVGR